MKKLITNLLSDWSRENPHRKLSASSVALIFAVTLGVIMIPVFMVDLPGRDVAFRYAPMADAFADGNFNYAFHPRVPMLHPLLAGVVAFLTGCDGFTACRIVSGLFFAAGVLPLLALMRRVFDRRIAMISAFIYACSTPLIHLGYSGLRDSAKSFMLIFISWALVRVYQERSNWRGYVLLGISCGVSSLIRVEMLTFSLAVLWLMFILECRCRKFAVWSLTGCLLAAFGALPALIQNYQQIGIATPDSYTATLLIKIFGHDVSETGMLLCGIAAVAGMHISAVLLSFLKSGHLRYAFIAGLVVAGAGFMVWYRRNSFTWPDGVSGYWMAVLAGSVAFCWIMALPGALVRCIRKEWKREDSLLLLIFFIHLIVVLGQFIFFKKRFYVSERYLASALPLLFGWAAYAMVMIWNLLDFTWKKWHYRRWIVRVIVAVLITVPIVIYLIFAYLPALKEVLPTQTRQNLLVLRDIAGQMRKHGVSEKKNISGKINFKRYVPPYSTGMTCWEYRRGKWRCNRSSNAVVSYFAGVRLVKSGGAYILYIWDKDEVPQKKPSRRHKLLFQTGDGEKVYQLWSAKR